MRQNTKKKRSGFGYFIRMFLLLVELLAVTLFLWGNDAYSISATTPEFKWENYKTIAHALVTQESLRSDRVKAMLQWKY